MVRVLGKGGARKHALFGGFRKAKRVSVGLDVGSSSIKLVALVRESGNRSYRLLKYGVRRIPAVSGEPTKQNTSNLIRELFAETKIDCKDVIAAVPGTSAVVRYIQMPKMTLQEARNALRYEASQYIPFRAEEARMDYHILNGALGQADDMMKMMLVATRTSEAERRLEVLKAAGLSPLVLDVDSLALLNAFETTGIPGETPGSIALIHLGSRQTHLSVVQDGCPAFTRDMEAGGETLTEAISRGLGLSLAEAEAVKVSGDAIIRPHLESPLRSLAGQLRSSLDYYQGKSGNGGSKVYLSGGTSLLKPLGQFLSESLGIPAEKWNPFQGIDTSDFVEDSNLRHIGPVLAVAVGLAIRKSTLS